MKIVSVLEGILQRVVSPLPAPFRAFLRSMFYGVVPLPVETMRYRHDHAHTMVSGLRELMEYLRSAGVDGTAAEIGSYAGESTEFFAKHFRHMHAVDSWLYMKTIEQAFDTRMSAYPHVRKWKMRSDEAAAHFADGSLDFVYIDADHHYKFVYQDIKLWRTKVRPGGVLAGHDYSKQEPGVQRAVDELLSGPDHVFADTSWVKGIK